MADKNVFFSTEEVNAAISNFNQRKNDFEAVFNGIKSTMFDLTGTWTGAASQAFETRTRELIDTLSSIQNSMDGAIQKLQTAINAYENTDNTNKAGIEGLDRGTGDYYV